MKARLAGSFMMTLMALALPLGAQEEKPVTWSLAQAPKAVKRGENFSVKVTAQIAAGWHLYSTTQAEGGPISTRVWLPEGQAFTAAGPLKGSKPKSTFDESFNMKVEYHDDSAAFTLPVQVGANAPAGAQQLRVSASFQACNDRLCLPPRTVKMEASIELK